MKCTNPVPCDGEMKTYKGIQAGKVECVKCGYRTEASGQPLAEGAKIEAPKKPKTSTEPTKENN